jgi:hypothetical protein
MKHTATCRRKKLRSCSMSSCWPNTRCGTKVMWLAMLCTNRQCCCLPLHMAIRLTPAVDSVQDWTCHSCYTIVDSIWSEAVFVRCITKMKVWATCHSLVNPLLWLTKSYKGLMENIPYPGHNSFLEGWDKVEDLSSWDPISHSTSLVYGLEIVYGLKMAE